MKFSVEFTPKELVEFIIQIDQADKSKGKDTVKNSTQTVTENIVTVLKEGKDAH